MKELSLSQLEQITGGGDWLATGAGAACGAVAAGFLFGGFGGVVSSAIFGPSCIGLTIGYLVTR